MSETVDVHVLPWKVPTPRGLWHRAFVLTERGCFVTPDIDYTMMQSIKAAAAEGAEEVVRVMTEHGRSKRVQFLPWADITTVRVSPGLGLIEIGGDDRGMLGVKIPDRERLEKVGKALTRIWKARSAESGIEA